jgi:solute carrier family 35, member E1
MLYNVHNKKATTMIHAPWFVSSADLLVGIVLSLVFWGSGMRKTPNLTTKDIVNCIPISVCACLSHGGSVLAAAVGTVTFAQLVKACEPVFAAVVGFLIPPMDVKPMLAYFMLIPVIGGVGLACIKEGKGVDINVAAFLYASMANASGALKGKLGMSITKSLKSDSSKNMDAANVYALVNIISFVCTVHIMAVTELATLRNAWNEATALHGTNALMMHLILSGIGYYFYNEFAFAFTASVGVVTSSVLNTAKRVIIIVIASIVFQETMQRNTVIGSAIAIGGTFAYSLTSKKRRR